MTHESWGRFPKATHRIHEPSWLVDPLFPTGIEGSVLPYGQGRSYGDVCLNDKGVLLSTRRLNRLIGFDAESGVLECEAGVTIQEILDFAVPRGFFVPVTPGTKFVSIGGAIANDVHGKNHHSAGTFGRHVQSFSLLRSDGSVRECSMAEHPEWFAATVGGLGLTGLIRTVRIKLLPIESPAIDMESVKFGSLDEFFEISRDSDQSYVYTVAWIDCLAKGSALGRGIFMRGNHARDARRGVSHRGSWLSVPIDLPPWTLNRFSVSAFNTLYYHRLYRKVTNATVHYDPFFYPLDAVNHWNRIYGSRGFLQFQCVVPSDRDHRAIRSVLEVIAASGRASFLAVLKEFGDVPSPGMLSFPRPGVTLCLDFPYSGVVTEQLFSRLERLTVDLGGAIYPAKDALMSGASFRRFFPRHEEFSRYIDPRCSSSFWRRVMQ